MRKSGDVQMYVEHFSIFNNAVRRSFSFDVKLMKNIILLGNDNKNF